MLQIKRNIFKTDNTRNVAPRQYRLPLTHPPYVPEFLVLDIHAWCFKKTTTRVTQPLLESERGGYRGGHLKILIWTFLPSLRQLRMPQKSIDLPPEFS
jgi:hypothetical protein